MRAPRIGDPSPWGTIDGVEAQPQVPGVVFVTTPSHGGFWVDDVRRIDPFLLSMRSEYSSGHWFEEDVDALIVLATWPELTDRKLESIMDSLRFWHCRRHGCTCDQHHHEPWSASDLV